MACAARRQARAHPANAGNKRFTGDRVAETQRKTNMIDWTAGTAPPDDAKIRRKFGGGVRDSGAAARACASAGAAATGTLHNGVTVAATC